MALYGIYGRHTTATCLWNNIDTARRLQALAESDLESTARKYNIHAILGQYHSALEHSFVWVVEADDPHRIQDFCVTTGLASINELKIVPLITFQEGVIPGLKKIHAL